MTSAARLAANRANARKSTGPRTAGGKAKSSANAVRHGLRAGPLAPKAAAAAQALEEAFTAAGVEPSPALTALAHAQVHLEEVRRLKRYTLETASRQQAAAAPPGSSWADIEALGFAAAARELLKLDNYERKAFSRWKRALTPI